MNDLIALLLENTIVVAIIAILCILLLRKAYKSIVLSMTMKKIDKLKGEQFEKYLKILFEHSGYKVRLTPKSSDFGGDLLLIDPQKKERIIVQAKRYNTTVGVSAVQEAVSAIKYYRADRAIVVTNSKFTRNAIQLAQINNVLLYDRTWLYSVINKKNKHAELNAGNVKRAESSKILELTYTRTLQVGKDMTNEQINNIIEEALLSEGIELL